MNLLAALFLAPLALAVIQRTKALFAGRRGPPLLQPYRDILKLLGKGDVISRTTTWAFHAGPVVGLATTLTALLLMPLAGAPAIVSFPGDFLLLIYLLSLGRFFTVLAALDTGSAFEGMGASREVWLGAMSEPALLVTFIGLGVQSGTWSLTGMLAATQWSAAAGSLVLAIAALLLVLLAEGARIPFDDPATHLELTMIHEAMILDHSGPHLAFLEYQAALKLWLFGSLLAGVLLPLRTGSVLADAAAACALLFSIAIVVGVIESSMARLRMNQIPRVLMAAAVLAVLGLALVVSGKVPQ